MLRRAPVLVVAVAAVASLAAGLAHASVTATPAAKCCTVTYNKAKTHVQVSGVVAYRGTPVLFSFHGPCASPAGPGRAYVKSRWIALRYLPRGYHRIDIVQKVNGKIVYSKSAAFFIAGRYQEPKPTAAITSGPTGVVEGTGAGFAFRTTNAAKTLCRLDALPWQACNGTVSYQALEPGPHVFALRAVSPSGKQKAEVTRQFVLSAPPPVQP